MIAATQPSWAGQVLGWLIRQYQRHLSPYKGFSCAYRVKKKRCSCSEFGRRVATRFGLTKLPALLRRRFDKCAKAARTAAVARVLDYEPRKANAKAKRQDGSLLAECRDAVPDVGCECLAHGGGDCLADAGCELLGSMCDGV